MSIRSKMLAVLIPVLMVTCFAFSVIWYRNASDTADQYLSDMSDSIMKDAYNAFDYLLTDTSYMITMISLNEENIVEPVQNINVEALGENGQLTLGFLQKSRIIRQYLSSMNGYKYYIVGISVVSKNGYVFQTNQVVQNGKEITEMIESADEETLRHSMVMMPPVPTVSTWINLKSNSVVPAVRAIVDKKNQVVGYTVLYFDYSVIEDMFSKNLPEGSLFQVVDEDENLIYSNCGETVINVRESRSEYVYNTFHAQKAGWNFVMAIPSEPILSRVRSSVNLSVRITVCLGIAAIAVCIFMVSRITNNIKKLNLSMNRVASGDLTVHKYIGSKDEIGQMEDNFNHMLEQVKGLMETVAEEEKQKRLVEIAFLQAQINPHFISNTLNIVSWMAKVQHADNLVPLTNALNNLLRGAMKQGDDLISLNDEISYVTSFLDIVEYSGSYDFEVKLEIDEGTKALYVLRFILQPIVENAIYHGIQMELDKEGVITIASAVEDEKLKITVMDNGQGMSEEQIARLLEGQEKMSGSFNGIGVHNVIERIRLFWGEEFGLQYESRQGEYTKAVFTLPVIHDKEEGNQWKRLR